MAEFAYVTVGTNHLFEAKAFYDALLKAGGTTPLAEHSSGGRIYGHPGAPRFAVLAPHDGDVATAGNGSMFAFRCADADEVDRLYNLAISLGECCAGPPGDRLPGRYFAYCRDLDQNKLCFFAAA